MTGLYARIVVLNLVVALALKGTDSLVADHNLNELLAKAIREEQVPADEIDHVTKTVTDLLPTYGAGLTIHAYLGRLRQAARNLR